VIRCFEDGNIVHVDGSIGPARDIETINLELIFADMEVMEKRIDKIKKMMKSGDRKYLEELAICEKIMKALESGMPARSLTLDQDEIIYVRDLFLLTSKPVLYAANISEKDLGDDNNPYIRELLSCAAAENAEVMVICAKIEEEIAALDDEEKTAFIEELGLAESGLDRLIKIGYRLLGLISYLTAGEPEVRAWTIEKGTKAPQAAGKIHSDFEKGFIRAEIVAYSDLMACGTYAAAREKGLVRSEGREYVMQDGDIVLFRFNV
jgi:GTP-binding protein YchF